MRTFPSPIVATTVILALIAGQAFADPAPSPAPDATAAASEMIHNGNFQDASNWKLELQGSASASLTIGTDGPDGKNAASIVVNQDNGEVMWNVGFSQDSLALIKGQKYRLTFSMKASGNRYTFVAMRQAHEPWGGIPGVDTKMIELHPAWKDFIFEFTPTADEPEARLVFSHLNQSPTTWSVANVSLTEVPAK